MAVANYTALWHVSDAAYASDTLAAGCFTVGATGTNKTFQTAIQRTDLKIDAAIPTRVTSVLEPFDGTDQGNYLWIPSGVTGFTSNRYLIQSVSSGVATLDAAPGAVNTQQTNGTIYLGGAMRSPGGYAAARGAAIYQTVHFTGSHTTTTDSSNVSGGRLTMTEGENWIGYNTTVGDNVWSDTMLPLFTRGASFSSALITTAANAGMRNVRISATNSGTLISNNAVNVSFCRSWIDASRFSDGSGITFDSCYLNFVGEASGNSFVGVNATVLARCCLIVAFAIGGALTARDCVIYRNSTGVLISNTIAGSTRWHFSQCSLIAATGYIFNGESSTNTIRNMRFDRCILWNEDLTSPDPVINSNEEYSILLCECAYPTAAPPTHTYDSNLLPNIGGVAIDTNPFTDTPNEDFSLTDTAKPLLRITAAVVPGIPTVSQYGWIGAEPIAPAAASGGGSRPALLGGAQYGY